MEVIRPRVTPDILNNDGYNNILDSIDCTIAHMATLQYQNDVFGFTNPVDYDLYDRLCVYREIFMDKMMGCNCLTDEYTILILSKIQSMT